MHRTSRESLIDVGVVVVALGLVVATSRVSGTELSLFPHRELASGLFGRLDASLPLPWYVNTGSGAGVAALIACVGLWWRRRWPVAVAAATLLAGALTPTATIPAMAALFTVAALCPTAAALAVAAVPAAMVPFSLLFYPGSAGLSALAAALVALVLNAGAVGWGLFVRSRRLLVASLGERARRAEEEAALRAEQAQRRAREEIAREMHDVLAHRLSLLSVHAGALEFHPDAPAAEVQRAAAVIRDSAHQALQDLRTVIGVLRAPTAEQIGAEPPQPTLADLDRLVAESRAAGAQVEVRQRITDPGTVPADTGRTVYRIVQEGLTNARKHAPGAPVRVDVRRGPGADLTVEVRNPLPTAALRLPIPGAGQGLSGLVERVTLAGGGLEHGTDGQDFVLRARLPWCS